MPVTGASPNATMMSPSLIPAAAAGDPLSTALTRTPDSCASPKWRTMRRAIGVSCPPDPRCARRTRPSRIKRDDDALGRVGGDGEADALRRQDDRRVDADDVARRIDQRPAGIAGIERGIGLDDVVEQTSRLAAHRAAERADDARGHRMLESVRAADGDRDLADAHAEQIGEPPVAQARRADLEDSEIGIRVVADEFPRRRAPVRQRHLDRTGAAGYVAVGYNIAVRGDDESRNRSLRAGHRGGRCARPEYARRPGWSAPRRR